MLPLIDSVTQDATGLREITEAGATHLDNRIQGTTGHIAPTDQRRSGGTYRKVDMSENENPTKLSASDWKKKLTELKTSVGSAVGELIAAEVSKLNATVQLGKECATAHAAFIAQGLETFEEWVTEVTGRPFTTIQSAMRASVIAASLPDRWQGDNLPPLEDLQRLGKVKDNEKRGEILDTVRKTEKLRGRPATDRIAELAKAHIESSMTADQKTAVEKKRTKDEEKKKTELRDQMRPKIAGFLKTLATVPMPEDHDALVGVCQSFFLAGCEVGENFGKGAREIASGILSEKGDDDTPVSDEDAADAAALAASGIEVVPVGV